MFVSMRKRSSFELIKQYILKTKHAAKNDQKQINNVIAAFYGYLQNYY